MISLLIYHPLWNQQSARQGSLCSLCTRTTWEFLIMIFKDIWLLFQGHNTKIAHSFPLNNTIVNGLLSNQPMTNITVVSCIWCHFILGVHGLSQFSHSWTYEWSIFTPQEERSVRILLMLEGCNFTQPCVQVHTCAYVWISATNIY